MEDGRGKEAELEEEEKATRVLLNHDRVLEETPVDLQQKEAKDRNALCGVWHLREK